VTAGVDATGLGATAAGAVVTDLDGTEPDAASTLGAAVAEQAAHMRTGASSSA
jgi:hypothetical protein